MTGAASCCAPVSGAELGDINLRQKPIESATLDYLNTNQVTPPTAISPKADKIYITRYFFRDSDRNIIKTLYRIYKNANLTEDEYHELLKSGEPLKYSVSDDYIDYYSGSEDYSTPEEMVEYYKELRKLTETDPKIAYDEYLKNFDNPYKNLYQTTNSGYTLTSVDQKAENTITKYSMNKDTFELTPQEYRVDLKKLNYGKGNTTKYFEWSNVEDRYGRTELKLLEVESPTDGKTTISYSYDLPQYNKSDDSYNAIYQNGTADLLKEEITGSGSSYNPYITNKYYTGSFKNDEGETISLNNVLFKDNNVSIAESNKDTYTYLNGGILYNAGTITGNLNGDFINNSVSTELTGTYSGSGYGSLYQYLYGGILYNKGNIEGDIVGNLVNNTISINRVNRNCEYLYGGLVYNSGNIGGGIKSNFINNTFSFNYPESASSGFSDFYGVVIYNEGTINDGINGLFLNNTVSATNTSLIRTGGLLYNKGTINGGINGTFVNNVLPNGNIISSDYYAVINGDITGDFVGNDVSRVININGTVNGNISGNFINNKGTAIYYSAGTINGNISGNFLGNDGAINGASVDSISGNFIGNSSVLSKVSSAYVTGDFINNGTVISNSNIEVLVGDFIRNGSLIHNGGNNTIGYLAGDFIQNKGGISGTIGTINGNFFNNENFSINGNINVIDGNFYKNTASESEYDTDMISANVSGAIKGDFVENAATAIVSTSAYNSYSGTIGKVDTVAANFVNNEVANGVIFNAGLMDNLSGRFLNNTISNGKAAVYTASNLNITADNGITEFTGNVIQTENGDKDYVAIYAGKNYQYKIHEDKAVDINLSATNNGQIIFNDKIKGLSNVYKAKWYTDHYGDTRYFDKDGNKVYQYNIYYNGTPPTQEQIASWGYDIDSFKLNIDGDSTGVVYLNNNVEAISDIPDMPAFVDINLSNTQLHLGVRDNVLDGNNLTLNSGTFNMVNGQAGVSALNKLTLAGDTNFVADVDLANSEMDRFTAQEYGDITGKLNVVGLNLVSDAAEDTDVTTIFFAEKELKDNVVHQPQNLPDSKVQEIYTPIYKYNSMYKNTDDGGYFVFAKGHIELDPEQPIDPENPTIPITPGGTTGNPSDAFNPAVLSSPVSSVAAAQATVNETFKYVFEHADAFTQMPAHVRFAKMNANKYALSTDFNNNIPMTDLHNKAAWFRPYATFETMNLKNGPKVDAITYGSLAGFDTDFHEHKHGWYSVGTGYIGYNGSQLSYKGVDTTMNGGILGYTHTMYKGNFWTALTLSAGASVGESRTMYGKEDFTSLMAGVGSKTGYNFEFKEGKYILQPIMFMSYTFVNTFDYTNAAGVRINADPAHSIQLNPSIRFISNFKNGWQPYASVGMVWNVMNENNVTANNVRLPEMSMKPYVEYGVGVQRNWKDKFTAFGQAMLRNGGRNGIALTAGFRWTLGKEGNPVQKVQGINKERISSQSGAQTQSTRKVLKQLSPQQKMVLTGKKNTTITSAKAVLKQL